MAKRGSSLKWVLILLVVAAGVYYGPGLLKKNEGGSGGMPPGGAMPASVATVVTKAVIEWHEFSGIFEAVDHVELRPRVGGQIAGIHFTDGTEVKKGQLLFTIDPRPYEAALISAQGTWKEAQSALARAKKLVGGKAISRAEFEAAQSAYDRALGNYKAAEVNLAYCKITAPIAGKISRAEITVGNVVDPGGQTPLLASIVALAPIYASFDIDEQTYLSTIQGVPAKKLKTIPVKVGLANEQGVSIDAHIHSFDNQLAPGSGTVRVRALVVNSDRTLIPGLFARVRLGSAEENDSVLINPTAVGTDQSKKFVLVVSAEGKAEYREVTLGSITDGLQVVREGLKPGEQIVVNGLQRVRPGASVMPTLVDMQTLQPLNPPPAVGDLAPTEAKPEGQ